MALRFKIKNWNAAKSFLNNYQFSSFGLENDSIVIDENIKKLISNTIPNKPFHNITLVG